MTATALTIAGSDPSGGAGIQADLKTFARLGVYGMAAITGLTVQNTAGVYGIFDTPADFVASQCDAVIADIAPGAVKTGMLANAAVVEAVAQTLERHRVGNLVLDPVMVATSGASLLRPEAVDTLKRRLAPLAWIVTPNLPEAGMLAGMEIGAESDMEEAARRIADLGARHVLVKGGHLEGDAADVFYDGSRFAWLRGPRIGAAKVHGTGCVLSAAIAAYLALGRSVYDAVQGGKDFVTDGIRRSAQLGSGSRVIV